MTTNEAPVTVELNECPPGLFTYNGTLCFKSEYTTTLENPRRYQCDAYVVESGEYFHGGAANSVARGRLQVTPVPASLASVPVEDGVEEAVAHLMATRRIGTASINEHQRDADNAKMREAYRDILTKGVPFLARPRAAVGERAFQAMDTWDCRDEAVLLLIDYRDGGEHPIDDADFAITIGHNNDHNVGPGEGQGWLFAGWCWTHDHYTQGAGKPVGWMPIPHILASAWAAFDNGLAVQTPPATVK